MPDSANTSRRNRFGKRGWQQGWTEYLRQAQPYQDQPWFPLLSRLRNELNDTSWYIPYTAEIDFDVEPILEQLTVPMLAFPGGADVLVPTREMEASLDSIKRKLGQDITVVVLEGAGHNMTREGSGQPVREYTRTLLDWTRDRTAHRR